MPSKESSYPKDWLVLAEKDLVRAKRIGVWLSNLAFLRRATNLHFGKRNSTLWLR
jgi:hypothetical protein